MKDSDFIWKKQWLVCGGPLREKILKEIIMKEMKEIPLSTKKNKNKRR